MRYGGVNPVDRYRGAGTVDADSPVPRTLGAEGAGTFKGRPVVVYGHGVGRTRDGIWSTRAIVPRAALIDVPAGVDLQHAAVMGVAGVTAWRTATELARVTKDDRVLVLGAAGGVGSVIVLSPTGSAPPTEGLPVPMANLRPALLAGSSSTLVNVARRAATARVHRESARFMRVRRRVRPSRPGRSGRRAIAAVASGEHPAGKAARRRRAVVAG